MVKVSGEMLGFISLNSTYRAGLEPLPRHTESARKITLRRRNAGAAGYRRVLTYRRSTFRVRLASGQPRHGLQDAGFRQPAPDQTGNRKI